MGLSWGNTVKRFQKFTNKTARRMDKDIQVVVDSTGLQVQKDAKKLTPVDTGRLRKHWKRIIKGKGSKRTFTILNDLEYAKFVENGTSKMAPKRMLMKSIIRGRKSMERRLKVLERRTANRFNRG